MGDTTGGATGDFEDTERPGRGGDGPTAMGRGGGSGDEVHLVVAAELLGVVAARSSPQFAADAREMGTMGGNADGWAAFRPTR